MNSNSSNPNPNAPDAVLLNGALELASLDTRVPLRLMRRCLSRWKFVGRRGLLERNTLRPVMLPVSSSLNVLAFGLCSDGEPSRVCEADSAYSSSWRESADGWWLPGRIAVPKLKIEDAASAAAFAAAAVKLSGVSVFLSCSAPPLPARNGRFASSVLPRLRRLTEFERGMSISIASPLRVVGIAIIGGGVGADRGTNCPSVVAASDCVSRLSESARTGESVSETCVELFDSSPTDSSSLEAYSSYRSASFRHKRHTRILPGWLNLSPSMKVVQLLQKILPQIRQWCLRRNVVNVRSQDRHFVADESSSQ
ncbi:hypothetical protein OGATHE_002297 [Ogataea polymorpha]|uniref:Uncharacterized protein n=1 Tax=Ogataea polymorpha TaxID=460523 RepID=A0A9P8TBR3_9ASCO|nr:hypothetical protein OGATHE_002297 [Ogataea polymorpha]